MPGPIIEQRLTEQRNPASRDIDLADAGGIVDIINGEDAGIAAAVALARDEIAAAIDMIAETFRRGGRLIYAGAGTSGRLGVLDATECPPTYGTPPELVQGIIAGGPEALVRSVEGAEDDLEAATRDIEDRQPGERDVVVGIAASGTTPYVRRVLEVAHRAGAHTAFVTCAATPDDVRPWADIVIEVPVGPEVVTGSTRMKAGTATKLVLNMLTTGALIRTGKVYGNLMVDLRAWNAKLVDRSERIVMETTGLDREGAKDVLRRAAGRVKPAIVMARRDVTLARAEAMLAEAGGRLRAVVGDPPDIES